MSVLSSALSYFRPKASQVVVRFTEEGRPIVPPHIGGIQRNSLFNAERVATAVFSHLLSFLSPKEIHSLRMSHYTGLTLERSMRMIKDQMEAQKSATVRDIRKYEKVMGKGTFSSDKITHLVVDDPNITEEEFISLIQRMPMLISIDLTDCINIRDASLIAIVEHLPKLQILNLRGCLSISSKGLKAIGTGCTGLISLDLSGCTLCGAKGLWDGFTTILLEKNLQYLKLVDCIELNDAMISAIALFSPELRVLDISGCKEITDLRPVECNCRKLESLHLARCSFVRDSFKFINEFHHLKYLNIEDSSFNTSSLILDLQKRCPNLQIKHTTKRTTLTQKPAPKEAIRSPQGPAPQAPQKRPSAFRFVMEHPGTHAAISALFAKYMGFWPGVFLFAGLQGVSYAMRRWSKQG